MSRIMFTSLFCMFLSNVSFAMYIDEVSETSVIRNRSPNYISDIPLAGVNSEVSENPCEEHINKSEKYFIKGIKEYKCRNFKESFYYLKKSALYDHDRAEYTIGLFHEFAIGTERNLKIAEHWYSKSKEHGNKEAKYALERVYNKENSIFYWLY